MANTSEAKINDEYNEGIAIENDLLTSTPIDNNVYCRTLLQNEFTFTPCHNFTNLKENTDTSFLAPSSSLGIRVIPRKHRQNRVYLMVTLICMKRKEIFQAQFLEYQILPTIVKKLRILTLLFDFRSLDVISFLDAQKQVDKKSSHLIALSSWLNFLLDEKHDADNNSEILAKSKRDVEQYLRKLLTSKNDIPAMKDNESQNNISYKFRLLYKSSPIPNDIATIVKDNKITVRMDRRVYADIGLQTELLSLFLSFHPFYLRLGLETILSINIEIRADCTNQLRGITYVIAQNIFKNPKIMNNRKYVQGKSKHGEITQYREKTAVFFVKWSAYKSINDVVVMLSRELMSGTSNLPKTLSRLGLFLDRKQGFFEQFQYHVTDLLKDLSNGMILGRTVEILANLPYNTVIHCLRDPGGDRLRKVSNMRTVIDFAKRKAFFLKNNFKIIINFIEDLYVDIDGIVQGNIDEIIQLLWRFVGKELGDVNELDNCDAEINSISDQLQSLFGISYEIRNPLELADGILFSLLWKQYYSYGIPFELFDGTTVLEQIANAAEYHFGIPSSMLVKWKEAPEEKALCLFTKIFYYAYMNVINLLVPRLQYNTVFQFYGSDRLARSSQLTAEEDAKRIKASITIQVNVILRFFRNNPKPYPIPSWMACTGALPKMKYDNTLQEREIKAVIIQKFIRGWLARWFYLTLLHEHNVRKQENASIVIQTRSFWLARKSEVRNGKILQNAARVLQKYIRGWLARLHYRNMLHELSLCRRENAAITLQKYIRGWLARLHYRNMLHELSLCRRENAAITLQRYARGWIIRQNYHKMRHDATKYIRGWLARLHYRNLLHELSLRRRENAAVTLQKKLLANASERSDFWRTKMCNIYYAITTVDPFVISWVSLEISEF
ncbi:hypothetical protein DINM_006113 [Dirofilaria immitis]|nr:hypothetical protein [Dirofilaria immitis]